MKGATVEIHAPAAWQQLLARRRRGTILVLGAADTGKTTFASWLATESARAGEAVAWLDGDMGQATLGPPTAMTVALLDGLGRPIPQRRASFFVGATSPRGHMLPTLVGVLRLREEALRMGAGMVVTDTTGFVDPFHGGVELKHWKVELLQPSLVVAFARSSELDPIVDPLRRDGRWPLVVLPVNAAVQRWSAEARAERRRELFRRYFENAQIHRLPEDLPRYGAAHAPARHGQLVALQDRAGFALGLGVMVADAGDPRVLTPVRELRAVRSLRLGSLTLDPETGQEGP